MNQIASLENISPAVSVVIPCRNERDYIESCLRSVFSQEAPPGGFEIIVVDGMSNDGTRDILAKMAAETKKLYIIDNPRQTTPCAMNLGVCEAKGQYIAILGAHNHYAPDYLRASVEVLEQTKADNVGGRMICEAESLFQEAIAASHHSLFSVGGARWHSLVYEGLADTVFGGVYRREVFDKIGLFDEKMIRNQDDEFNLRLKNAGGTIWQSPRIRSWYWPRRTFGELFSQHLQYGYWKIPIIQKHKLPASIRHVVPGSFVLLLFVLPLFSLWWPSAGWVWLGIVGTYTLCNILASLLLASRKGWKLLPVLPVIFACYHLSYGYGFLQGILDLVVLRRGPNKKYTRLTRTSRLSL